MSISVDRTTIVRLVAALLCVMLPKAESLAQSPTVEFVSRGGQLSGTTRAAWSNCPPGTPVSRTLPQGPTINEQLNFGPLGMQLSTSVTPKSYSCSATVIGVLEPGQCSGPAGGSYETVLLRLPVSSVVYQRVTTDVFPFAALAYLYQAESYIQRPGGVYVSTPNERFVLDAGDYYMFTKAIMLYQSAFPSWSIACTGTLTILAPCTRIVENPRDAVACPGSVVQLRFGVQGPGPFTFRWTRNDVLIGQTTSSTYADGTVVTSFLDVPNVTAADYGIYMCTVSTPYGSCTEARSRPGSIYPPQNCAIGVFCNDLTGACRIATTGGVCQRDETFKPGITSCTPSPCPNTLAPCCTPSGCQMIDFMQCPLSGFGNLSCNPNPCPGPMKGCCDPSGACAMVGSNQPCPPGWCGALGMVCEPMNPCRPANSGVSCFTIILPIPGVCCMGATCTVTVSQYACQVAGGKFIPGVTVCNAPGNSSAPCCLGDFNTDGSRTVDDIYLFISAWFRQDPRCDVGEPGLTVDDIFIFINLWFQGC